jgi:hypothetical protein
VGNLVPSGNRVIQEGLYSHILELDSEMMPIGAYRTRRPYAQELRDPPVLLDQMLGRVLCGLRSEEELKRKTWIEFGQLYSCPFKVGISLQLASPSSPAEML